MIHSLMRAACVLLAAATLHAQEMVKIWPTDSPELRGVGEKHVPTLQLFPGPAGAGKKPAVLLCPAGGYKHHSDQAQNVKWLNGLGIAAYVLKYRLPGDGYKHPAPLHDAQRAMRIIRQNAEQWGLDSGKIGVLGGSSGGHLASTLATHYDTGDKATKDSVEQHGCRPDFVILTDAVITMQGKACHTPSLARLLPQNPPKELVDNLSTELQVTEETPPTLLVTGGQDELVPAENSLMFFMALRKQRVAFAELHFFSHGGHGFQTPEWQGLAEGWLRRLSILPVKEGEKPWLRQGDIGAWKLGLSLDGK